MFQVFFPDDPISVALSLRFHFSNRVDEHFHRYCSHSLQALQFTGPITIHFRVTARHGSGVFEVTTTEGRRVWVILHSWYDDIISPAIGDEYCLFQGFCCGSVGHVPIFLRPPRLGTIFLSGGQQVTQHQGFLKCLLG